MVLAYHCGGTGFPGHGFVIVSVSTKKASRHAHERTERRLRPRCSTSRVPSTGGT